MTSQISILSRVRTWWNRSSFNNNPYVLVRFSRTAIDAAARVRIHTREMEDFGFFQLVGRRNELKLAIAQALESADKIPGSGLIEIHKLDASVSRRVSGLGEPIWLEKDLPLIEIKFTGIMAIKGFFFEGKYFSFRQPLAYEL